ncbi:MAG: RtcB family protein, partial [Myxococcales bacterium]|nr:RtcB family protein [Myxococcales bacterium]
MSNDKQLRRVLAALARRGLDVERHGPVWSIRGQAEPGRDRVPSAEVLLPDGFELSSKAAEQLARFAAADHPAGGCVHAARATPDFHAGSSVPVGAVVATSPDMLVPEAIGTDINCGMRLHVIDLDLERFMAGKAALVEDLRGDLLLGTRDLPMRRTDLQALYREGAPAWLEALRRGGPLGRLRSADLGELEDELLRSHDLGSFQGSERWL